MPNETRVAQFRVTTSHPDFDVAAKQLVDARRLGNTLNYVARKMFEQRLLNREFNKTVTDRRRLIRNPHTKLDALYTDPILIEMGVIGWIKKNRLCSFKYRHDFAELAQILTPYVGGALNAKVIQLIGMKLAESWKSYGALLARFFADPAHNQKPSPPGYKRVFGYVEFNKQAIKGGQKPVITQGTISSVVPTGWSHGFTLPDGLTLADVSSARLVVRHAGAFDLEVVYNVPVPEGTYADLEDVRAAASKGTLPLTAAMDLGQNILAAIVFSDARPPVLVNGKPLKSINRHANKQNAQLRSHHDVERKHIFKQQTQEAYLAETGTPKYPYPIPSQRLDRLWTRRNDRIDQYIHTASSRVISMLVNAGVKILIIGWNPGFKDGINMGRKNNQKFAQIPHARFRDQLLYKGRAAGITVLVVEESYTSKASFLDEDFIPTYGTGNHDGWKPSGRRTNRGMYKSAAGILIHADVNGAYNLLAKHVVRVNPNKVVTDKDVVVHPVWLAMPGLSHKPDTAGYTTLKPLAA